MAQHVRMHRERRPLSGLVVTYADAADTSETPNASPMPRHRSGFDQRAVYDIPCFVPDADDQADNEPKTRLICRRCGARTKLARQLPWIDHKLPAVPLFQCIDWGHVDLFEWPEPEGLSPRQTPPSSREAARGGVRELVEKHGSGRRTHHRHPKFPLAMVLPFNSSRCRSSFRRRFQQLPRTPFVGVPWRTEQYRVQPPLRRRPHP